MSWEAAKKTQKMHISFWKNAHFVFAIIYAKKLVPEKAGWVEQMPGNIVKLRLGDIDKAQKVFEKVELKAICFTPKNIEAEVALL